MIYVFDICQCFVYNTDVYVFVVFMCLIYVNVMYITQTDMGCCDIYTHVLIFFYYHNRETSHTGKRGAMWFGRKYPQILMNGKRQGRGGLRDRMDGSLLLAVQLCYVRDVVIYETTRIKFMVR